MLNSELPAASAVYHAVIGTEDGLRVLGAEGSDLLAGAPITAVHPNAGVLWALVDHRDLYRMAGAVPEQVANLDGAGRATCVTTHADAVFVGGDDARLWRLSEAGTLDDVTSFDEAPTRHEWHTPWGGPPAVFSMASDGDDLYVSVHVGGVLRSSDGSSWSPTIDLHDDVHQVAVDAEGTVWAATGMRGLAESRDRGATWRYHSDGLHGTYLLAVAAVAGGAIVAASSGHAARDGALYRLHDGHFERCAGLPDDLGGAVGPRQLAADGNHCVVALPGGDVYESLDCGDHWTVVARQLRGVSEVTLWASVSAAPAGGGQLSPP